MVSQNALLQLAELQRQRRRSTSNSQPLHDISSQSLNSATVQDDRAQTSTSTYPSESHKPAPTASIVQAALPATGPRSSHRTRPGPNTADGTQQHLKPLSQWSASPAQPSQATVSARIVQRAQPSNAKGTNASSRPNRQASKGGTPSASANQQQHPNLRQRPAVSVQPRTHAAVAVQQQSSPGQRISTILTEGFASPQPTQSSSQLKVDAPAPVNTAALPSAPQSHAAASNFQGVAANRVGQGQGVHHNQHRQPALVHTTHTFSHADPVSSTSQPAHRAIRATHEVLAPTNQPRNITQYGQGCGVNRTLDIGQHLGTPPPGIASTSSARPNSQDQGGAVDAGVPRDGPGSGSDDGVLPYRYPSLLTSPAASDQAHPASLAAPAAPPTTSTGGDTHPPLPSSLQPPQAAHHLSYEADAEEARRRARRLHRKRLAQIVVNHWKACAHPRLQGLRADRHYNQQLLGAGLVGLQTQVVVAAAAWRLATVHANKCSYLLMGNIIKAWHQGTQRVIRLRQLQHQAHTTHLQAIKRQAVRWWRQWQLAKAQHRKHELQAKYYYAFITLTKVLREWGLLVARSKAKALAVAQAEAAWCRSLLARAWAAWLQYVDGMQLEASKVSKALACHRWHVLLGVLQGWRAHVVHVHAARAALSAVLAHVSRAMWDERLRHAVREWQAICHHKQLLSSLLLVAKHQVARRRCVTCLLAWASWAREQREFRLAAGVLAPLGRVWWLRVCWDRMVAAVEISSGLRAQQMREHVLIRAAFRTWWAYRLHAAHKRQLLRSCQVTVGRVTCRAVLRHWHTEAMRLKAKAIAWIHAEEAHRAHRLRSCLSGLRWYAFHQHMKRQASAAAVQHHTTHLLSKAWQTWSAYHGWRIVKRDVTVWARRSLLVAVLHAWADLTRQHLAEERQWRTAVRHRYLTLLCAGMSGLRSAVMHAASKRKLLQTAHQHHGHVLLSRALHGWSKLFLPLAADARARAARAAGQWKRNLLRRAFIGWQMESARLAIKHAKEREADAFARQSQLGRALEAWQQGIREQRARKAAKAHRLAVAVQVLGLKAAARMLQAWRDVHVQLMLQRFQMMCAAVQWRESTARRVLASWSSLVQKAHAKALLLARASQHRKLHCLQGCWSAWLLFCQHQQQKKRWVASAVQHAHWHLCKRGLAALRWYVQCRQHKAANMQAATQLHQHMLQKEGVECWLRVGLWRCQQRLQHTAALQARALAVELALVEPYARHWLRATRARAARRLAGVGSSWSSSAWSHHLLGEGTTQQHANPGHVHAAAHPVTRLTPLPAYKPAARLASPPAAAPPVRPPLEPSPSRPSTPGVLANDLVDKTPASRPRVQISSWAAAGVPLARAEHVVCTQATGQHQGIQQRPVSTQHTPGLCQPALPSSAAAAASAHLHHAASTQGSQVSEVREVTLLPAASRPGTAHPGSADPTPPWAGAFWHTTGNSWEQVGPGAPRDHLDAARVVPADTWNPGSRPASAPLMLTLRPASAAAQTSTPVAHIIPVRRQRPAPRLPDYLNSDPGAHNTRSASVA